MPPVVQFSCSLLGYIYVAYCAMDNTLCSSVTCRTAWQPTLQKTFGCFNHSRVTSVAAELHAKYRLYNEEDLYGGSAD